jgi:GcrA cell cycle regulator
MRFRWTPDTIARLKELWFSKQPVSEIAEALGTSNDSVESKARRLGFGPHPNARMPKREEPFELPNAEPLDLRRHRHTTCSWPKGHPGTPGFHFCGAKTVPGRPYCEEHCRDAYQPTKPMRIPVVAEKVIA